MLCFVNVLGHQENGSIIQPHSIPGFGTSSLTNTEKQIHPHSEHITGKKSICNFLNSQALIESSHYLASCLLNLFISC